jgi:tripartite-type tricarboxylate transporter receptor subunit TctC
MTRTWASLLAALALAAGSAGAQAQSYPTRTIRLVAPYAPGGIADIAARLVGQKLTVAWGQPAITENRPGANGFSASPRSARRAGRLHAAGRHHR